MQQTTCCRDIVDAFVPAPPNWTGSSESEREAGWGGVKLAFERVELNFFHLSRGALCVCVCARILHNNFSRSECECSFFRVQLVGCCGCSDALMLYDISNSVCRRILLLAFVGKLMRQHPHFSVPSLSLSLLSESLVLHSSRALTHTHICLHSKLFFSIFFRFVCFHYSRAHTTSSFAFKILNETIILPFVSGIFAASPRFPCVRLHGKVTLIVAACAQIATITINRVWIMLGSDVGMRSVNANDLISQWLRAGCRDINIIIIIIKTKKRKIQNILLFSD